MFVFKLLREKYFKSESDFSASSLSCVIFGDQATDLIAAVLKAFPDYQI